MQVSYSQDIDRKAPGLRFGMVEGETINSFSNLSSTNKAYETTISNADLQSGITLNLANGLSRAVAVNVGDATLTTTALAVLLQDAINEDLDLAGYVVAVAAAAVVTITSKLPNADFTVTAAVNTASVISVAISQGVEIPFGFGMVFDPTVEDLIKLPSADTQVFAGVAVYDLVLPAIPNGTGVPVPRTSYLPGDVVSALARGRVYVEVSVAVTQGQTAYLDVVGTAGKFTNVSTDNISTNGIFLEGGSDLALIQL